MDEKDGEPRKRKWVDLKNKISRNRQRREKWKCRSNSKRQMDKNRKLKKEIEDKRNEQSWNTC